MGLECLTPQILVSLVTCNWRSLYVNLFNAAVTTHQKPVFTSECTETVWRPGLQLSLTPLAGFRWRVAGPLERKRKKREEWTKEREEGREKFKKERWQRRRLMKKGRKRQRVGKQGRRDGGIEEGKEEGREEGWTPPILRCGGAAAHQMGCRYWRLVRK